jgi:hypothetical protein
MNGKFICLYGPTGAGKTTQAGELAKWVWKTRKQRTRLNTSDRGGYAALGPLVRAGIIEVNAYEPTQDIWMWIDEAVKGKGLSSDTGAMIFDSGTSMGEFALSAAASSPFQIGQRKGITHTVTRGKDSLTVSSASDAQYGVVQGFMRERIWESSWRTREGVDVIWNFLEYRSEDQDRTPILGPRLVGKALTPVIPSWFEYAWRIASIPGQGDEQPKHVLYTAEHSELAGLGHSFGNSRIPLGVEPLPAVIEPASLAGIFESIDQKHQEADDLIKRELGL